MEVIEGCSYHIKDEFFNRVQDKYLMSNKEDGNYRPHFLAIQDDKNKKLYWMIPISSQVSKYKIIIAKKIKRYGRCNTIVIGRFAGKDNAFLIQNTFPILEKYFDHVHTIEGKPVIIHSKLAKELISNLREVLAMHKQGIHLIFPDIDYIQRRMEDELSNNINPSPYLKSVSLS